MKMEFTAEMIAAFLKGEIIGEKGTTVSTISSIEEGHEGALSYLMNPKYESFIYSTKASIVLVNRDFEPKKEISTTLIRVDNAGEAILQLLKLYNDARPKRSGVSRLSSVGESVTLPESCYIGDFTVVERGATIGEGAQIYPQCYLGEGVSIGEGTILYAGVKIYEGCKIGRDCIIHSGTVIGADGFGFAPNAEGGFDKIPQLGDVIIEDRVEIGANTCIDRAKTNSTIIKSGVKLDNLIQVGHNVIIGENTVSSAQMGIAGSSKVGRNCMFGGQVGIADHVTIGDRVMIGSQSGIDKAIPDGEVRMGSPALPGIQYHRSSAIFKDLPDMARTLRRVERELAKLQDQ